MAEIVPQVAAEFNVDGNDFKLANHCRGMLLRLDLCRGIDNVL
ncbi:MAG: hypothetical protein AAF438_15035 [Pseudomonadota bacterium]